MRGNKVYEGRREKESGTLTYVEVGKRLAAINTWSQPEKWKKALMQTRKQKKGGKKRDW